MNRAQQLEAAADMVEGWLDKKIVEHPRKVAIGCGIAGFLLGLFLSGVLAR